MLAVFLGKRQGVIGFCGHDDASREDRVSNVVYCEDDAPGDVDSRYACQAGSRLINTDTITIKVSAIRLVGYRIW